MLKRCSSTTGGTVQLLQGLDPLKDQSYFLAGVPAAALAKCEFPLGALRKEDVRAAAAAAGSPSAAKRSSAGICFIGGQSSLCATTEQPRQSAAQRCCLIIFPDCSVDIAAGCRSFDDFLSQYMEPCRHYRLVVPQSHNICVAGRRSFGDFLSQYVDPVPGRFVVVGGGHFDYGACSNMLAVTLGQRAGIGGAANRSNDGRPAYLPVLQFPPVLSWCSKSLAVCGFQHRFKCAST